MKRSLITFSLAALIGSTAVAAEQPRGRPADKPVVKESLRSVNALSPRMRDAFIEQIAAELYSSNLYLSFASYFADTGLEGCEKLFREASNEEREHAILFFNLLVDRGEKVLMNQVNASAFLPTSPLDAFTKLLENEIKVTKLIHNLYILAIEEKDYASQVFLHEFLSMQVQEEKEAQDLLQLMEGGATDPAFVLMFDQMLQEKND